MIGEGLEQKIPFGMVRVHESALAEVGCTAMILNVTKKYDDGRLDIAAEGKQRFKIVQLDQDRSFLRGEVTFFEDQVSRVAKGKLETAVQLHQELFEVLGQTVETNPDA